MTASLLGPAAPGFDRPLDVLEACHGRIARQCDTLDRLLAHLPGHGADRQAQQAARAVLAYFDTAGVHHHDDEERNLFPLLEEAGAAGTCDLVEALTLEHDELALLWQHLRIQLAPIAEGRAADLDAPLTQRFIALNRSHLDFENAHVLPLARAVLDAAARERLGRAMAARRRVPFPEAP
ncbi:hemerythrin domain-containing protein [Thiobacillus sedimenti]|uniref:Hemerythrin domain-containing protein n=1 Tax=Thiobacillus sedimenti TaxID=3110231 RepID=A0ABZ1CPW5_9PROT|nr:hemerythrin domain-containing protein [Thiobacillus sp. SCUT-2]WRS40362.1 hemerythrin domain-containing protein [Thiobacillus sp. SCUT-2]